MRIGLLVIAGVVVIMTAGFAIWLEYGRPERLESTPAGGAIRLDGGSEPSAQPSSRVVPAPSPSNIKGVMSSMQPEDLSQYESVENDTNASYAEVAVGNGAEAVPGKTVTVNYRGWLTNGTVFDESYKRGQPFSFVLGQGQVISGWDNGLVGMKTGGKRRLVIPPAAGYGSNSAGSIPPNSVLVFDVEMLEVK